MQTLTDAQFDRLWRLEDHLKAYGYEVISEPMTGWEDLWLDDISQTCFQIESEANRLRSRYGYRGRSQRLLADLHRTLREPSFNVRAA